MSLTLVRARVSYASSSRFSPSLSLLLVVISFLLHLLMR